MTTPLAPTNSLFTRIYLGEVDALTEEAHRIGVTRSVGVAEIQTFNVGRIRLPTGGDGSVRLEMAVANNANVFALPGTSHALIATSTAGTNANLVADVPVSSVSADVQIGEIRRFVIDNSPTNGLPAWGAMDYDKIGAAISAGENSAEVELGAAAVGQQLQLAAIVTAFTGTDITVQVQHDTTGMASPTAAFTSPLTFTGTGQQTQRTPVDTAITDTFWRFVIAGTFSNAELLCGFGIT